MIDSLERAVAETEEVTLSLHHYIKTEQLDPQRLQGVQDRLSLIANFRRKYGITIPDMLNTLVKLEDELASIGQADETLEKILAELILLESKFKKDAQALFSVATKSLSALG